MTWPRLPTSCRESSLVGGSVTDIVLRNSRLCHQRERLPHGFSYQAAQLAFTDGDVVPPYNTAIATTKPNHSNDNSRSFAIAHLDGSTNPTTPASKSQEKRDHVITNSLVISGCGGCNIAVIYISSSSGNRTSSCATSQQLLRNR